MISHELAKQSIYDIRDRDKTFEIETFQPHSSWGFLMYATALPADYDHLISELFAIGLEPNLQRIRKTPTVWHYETLIEVPQDWQPKAG